MFLSYLILLTALSLSAIAAYYSIIGLTAIFAAAVVPIVIMGGILEASKLVVTVWLHEYWHKAAISLRTYLSAAVVTLMFITSMGIFGFLSKAHIEQTSAAFEGLAQIERIDKDIARAEAVIARAEEQIIKLETSDTKEDNTVQTQIDREQERIDTAYERVQPAIDEQNNVIQSRNTFYNAELAKVDAELAQLQAYIDSSDIKKAQQMVGAVPDGAFGPNTARKFQVWQEEKQNARAEILSSLDTDAQVLAAREEIQRLRRLAETQIAESNKLINRLRDQVGVKVNTAQLEADISEQRDKIKLATTDIDTLTEQKYQLETENRKLEAEVGPIKYIAELVYGHDADQATLEIAVRWVIIILVAVFDPLAIVMLLAATESLKWYRKEKENMPKPVAVEPAPVVQFNETKASIDSETVEGYNPEFKQSRVVAPEYIDDTEVQQDEVFGVDMQQTVSTGDDTDNIYTDSSLASGSILEEETEIFEVVDTVDDNEDWTYTNIRPIEEEKPVEVHVKPTAEGNGKFVWIEEEAVEEDDVVEEDDEEQEFTQLLQALDQSRKNYDLRMALINEARKEAELPDGVLKPVQDGVVEPRLDYGIEFPAYPALGDKYIRVDNNPTKLYVYTGNKWEEVSKEILTEDAYSTAYIDLLIKKLTESTYTAEMLDPVESAKIEQRLIGE